MENIKANQSGGYRSKEQRRLDAQRKGRIRELEGLIEQAEADLAQIEEEMTKEEVFSDYRLMNEKCAAADQLRQSLEGYYAEWGELE